MILATEPYLKLCQNQISLVYYYHFSQFFFLLSVCFHLRYFFVIFAQVTVCCIDPEDYSRLPLSQFEEDNILREMNKSLLGFRQRHIPSSPTDPVKSESDIDVTVASRRLSPIGESFSSTPPEIEGDDKILSTNNGIKGDTIKKPLSKIINNHAEL